jgi:ferredoxin--NADP+ reductase
MTQEWRRAEIRGRIDWTDGLFTLKTDSPLAVFRPGQYLEVGLDTREGRLERPFSIASAPGEPLEFLVVRVDGEGELSPHLDGVGPGDSLWVGTEARGTFVLERAGQGETLWMFATGSGIAPYVSMLRTEEPWERFRTVVLVHGLRHRGDAAYRDELERRARQRAGRLRVLRCVSREDPGPGELAGRATDALDDGRLVRAARAELSPGSSHVLLCGNPGMVRDVTARLEQRGFRGNGAAGGGQITTELYW